VISVDILYPVYISIPRYYQGLINIMEYLDSLSFTVATQSKTAVRTFFSSFLSLFDLRMIFVTILVLLKIKKCLTILLIIFDLCTAY